MHVSTAWTDVLSQGQNGEPTSHPVWMSSWKAYPCCAKVTEDSPDTSCACISDLFSASWVGTVQTIFSYSTPVKLCEWHISLGILTFCAIILMVTRWLSTMIWWTSGIFSSVVAACEGTGHSSSSGFSLPCLISAIHGCIWWYIILQSLHHILMNILAWYPLFLRCTDLQMCAKFFASLNKSPCCLLP